MGHYFDAGEPTLKATVQSLNSTTLVYPPGTHTKYSNAAIAVVGEVLEKQSGQPFTGYVRDAVLAPLGMRNSAFTPTADIVSKLAHSFIWTYDRRIFEAPTFQLGIAPAGCMYSSVSDLSKFLEMLFAEGQGSDGRVLKPETLRSMWEPQFSDGKSSRGFGIGFALSRLDGHALVGHGGAIYGFATELEALPKDRLGVAVVTTMDSSNAVMSKIANKGLRLMLAAKAGRPMPVIEQTTAVPVSLARAAAAHYELSSKDGKRGLDLVEENGQLSILPSDGGRQLVLREQGNKLITDDRLSYGQEMQLFHDGLKTSGGIFKRGLDNEPKASPGKWDDLIGEYGWDYDTLYILEKAGKLTSLIEWYDYQPLEQIAADVFRYPARGLYDGETVTFTRDASGRAIAVRVGGVVFKRRLVGPADGKIFRIKPMKPVAELRAHALASKPPVESGTFKSQRWWN